jgi:hypothetical protein
MPTQMNFGPKQNIPVASQEATVNHAQSNFDGGRTTKPGKFEKGENGQQLQTSKANFSARPARSHFGEKSRTGQNGGY